MAAKHSRIVDRALSRLKLRQLRLLVAVGRHGNIQNAARELGVSQPAATKMIQDLELDFEVTLFQRTNRGVIPTVFGDTLIRHGKLIFAQVSSAAQELDDLNEGSSGRVVIGTLLAASPSLLPGAIEILLTERPKVAIKVTEGTNEVLNLVFGTPSEISDHLIPQSSVRLVAFTGSTAVGRHLTTLAAQHMTPVLMELGGHAPVIVCEDTDVEKAAISGAMRKMRNAGQVCTSPTRFFVHESIFDSFTEKFVERAAATVVGNGMDDGVEMGPLANERRVPALTQQVEDARAAGAEVRTGGARHGTRGYFYQPTVLTNVPDHADIMQEEPFGPIAVINPVSCLEDAIQKANSVPYGLAGYAFTNRADYIDHMIDTVEVGNLSINTLEASMPETPFGGVKSSGHGREGGTEGLDNYMTIKNVWHSADIA